MSRSKPHLTDLPDSASNELAPTDWSAEKSADLYGPARWGAGYFSINQLGEVVCHPRGPAASAHAISIYRIVQEAALRGVELPLLVRFGEILEHRISAIAEAFEQAIRDNDYGNEHLSIYPIKVNQQRHVVGVIRESGDGALCGLEAGSKPELMAVLALSDNDTTIVCNGFKDQEYVELATLGRKIGRNVIPVVEKPSELDLILEMAQRHGTRPEFGVRIKLASRGSGRWSSSAGHGSKFGLTACETIELLRRLIALGQADSLRLLHFHIGSQITDIRQLKSAITEAARVYAELRLLGAEALDILDVGGGLAIDYEGSQSQSDSSMNYTLQEYASDVVYHLGSVCRDANVPEPRIFTECGRAITAYHSVLLCKVVGTNSYGQATPRASSLTEEDPQPLHDLADTWSHLSPETLVECFHDAQTALDEALTLFRLGYLSLEQRSRAEELYWAILSRINRQPKDSDLESEELGRLDQLLTDIYFCNMSIFQSLPDSWAIDQLFPIMPIHRLNERPLRTAVLADISCDSDGKVDRFVLGAGPRRSLPLHDLGSDPGPGEYILGFFLVGAYQEILGDLHNLFGDTNAVHVALDDRDQLVFEEVIPADTVREVLQYVQFDVADLAQRFRRGVEQAVRDGVVAARESGPITRYFEASLEGTTYLERPVQGAKR